MRLGALLVVATLTLAGCETGEPFHQQRIEAFGIDVDIAVHGLDPDDARRTLEDTLRGLPALDARAALQEINLALGQGGVAPLTEPLLHGRIEAARRLEAASRGLYAPGIGRLHLLWGLQSTPPSAGPPPDAAALVPLVRAAPTLEALQEGPEGLVSTNTALQLHLEPLLRGHAVDRWVEALRQTEASGALVSAGASLRGYGRRGERGWVVGLPDPRGDGLLASLELGDDEALISIGDQQRYYEFAGTRYHHILDPRTGYPAIGLRAVNVVHRSAEDGEAAAIAMMVAGPRDWPEVAAALGVSEALVVLASGAIEVTPGLAQRIALSGPPPSLRPLP